MSDLIRRDQQFVWHPFTQHETEEPPIAISHAKNALLFTEDGREILDLISSWWTCLHGHANDALNAAIQDQARKMAHIMFSGFTHGPAVDLAEKIASVLPDDLSKIFFSDNGSTAVEVALKLATQYWINKGEERRQLFIALEGGYHGDTLGAMSVGRGSGFFNLFRHLMCEVETIPFAATWEGDGKIAAREEAAIAALDALLAERKDDVAALIIEPLCQGAAGMRICRPQFVEQIVARVRACGGLIIFDEVATGFGRTGTLFAFEQIAGVTPDVICLSKGLTGGYMPLSLTVAREALFQEFLGRDFQKALPHGHSFTANPLASAVALKSLSLFEENNALAQVSRICKQHKTVLNELQNMDEITRPRVLGSVLACDLSDGDGGYKSHKSLALRDWYLQNGFNIRPIGSTLYLMPPYCITDEELGRAYEGLITGIKTICRG